MQLRKCKMIDLQIVVKAWLKKQVVEISSISANWKKQNNAAIIIIQ